MFIRRLLGIPGMVRKLDTLHTDLLSLRMSLITNINIAVRAATGDIMGAIEDLRVAVDAAVAGMRSTAEGIEEATHVVTIAASHMTDKAEQHSDPELQQMADRLNAALGTLEAKAKGLRQVAHDVQGAGEETQPATQPEPPPENPPADEEEAESVPADHAPPIVPVDPPVENAPSGNISSDDAPPSVPPPGIIIGDDDEDEGSASPV